METSRDKRGSIFLFSPKNDQPFLNYSNNLEQQAGTDPYAYKLESYILIYHYNFVCFWTIKIE